MRCPKVFFQIASFVAIIKRRISFLWYQHSRIDDNDFFSQIMLYRIRPVANRFCRSVHLCQKLGCEYHNQIFVSFLNRNIRKHFHMHSSVKRLIQFPIQLCQASFNLLILQLNLSENAAFHLPEQKIFVVLAQHIVIRFENFIH